LNGFVSELISIRSNDHVLDIGCGTGNLISDMARQINDGYIEGVEFSSSMVLIAQRRNKKNIKIGKVKILEADFNELSYENNYFNKVCSVNTIYFWPEPAKTVRKVANILKPGGLFILAFEDIKQLEKRNLNKDVFRLFSTADLKNLLANSGFFSGINIESRTKGKSIFHCVVAKKHNKGISE
jgi:ubiquinone/menaquinone biosynthesis C-methylase UbiE